MASRQTKQTDSRLAARCAASASLGAAVIHFAVTPMHWRDWLASGLFFAGLATFQLVWAFLAWSRPQSLVLAAGIAANAGAAALWVMSCIVGPPFGPSAGQPEAVSSAGISVLLLQCYVVMGAGWAWSRQYRPEPVPGFRRAMVLMGTNSVVVMIEAQVALILDCLRQLADRGARSIEVRDDVQRRYNQEIQRSLSRTVWNSGGCQSWYLAEDGHNYTLWPGTTREFRARTQQANPEDYLFTA